MAQDEPGEDEEDLHAQVAFGHQPGGRRRSEQVAPVVEGHHPARGQHAQACQLRQVRRPAGLRRGGGRGHGVPSLTQPRKRPANGRSGAARSASAEHGGGGGRQDAVGGARLRAQEHEGARRALHPGAAGERSAVRSLGRGGAQLQRDRDGQRASPAACARCGARVAARSGQAVAASSWEGASSMSPALGGARGRVKRASSACGGRRRRGSPQEPRLQVRAGRYEPGS